MCGRMLPSGRAERGMALVTTLLMMFLVSSLLVGFTIVLTSDTRYRAADRSRTEAFYAAHAGMEKLTADLGNLFQANFAPNAGQLAALQQADQQPVLDGIQFLAADGSSGYTLSFPTDQNGNPQAASRVITSGPYSGLQGLVTPYTIDVTARTRAGGDVHLQRNMNTVSIPVFQFGTFSETDLSFFAGPTFNFGGRVHSNGNIFLAEGGSNTLTLSDKVTAVGEVIRTHLSNGWDTNSNYNGTVKMAYKPGGYRNLAKTEGSLVNTLGSAENEPTWTNISLGAYKGYLRNGRTGVTRLDLPLISVGGQNLDLIRRPETPTENVTNPTRFGQRYFSQASLRILLSDTAADIMALPTVTGVPPVSLENWNAAFPAGYGAGAFDNTHPPVALTGMPLPPIGGLAAFTQLRGAVAAGAGTILVDDVWPPPPINVGPPMPGVFFVNGVAVHCTGNATNSPSGPRYTGCTGTPAAPDNAPLYVSNPNYKSPQNTGLIGGFLKIEKQDRNGVWTDVTMEILNLGIAAPQLQNPGACAVQDRTPDAIIRLQRFRDNPGGCDNDMPAAGESTNFWPLALFDPREGNLRDQVPTGETRVPLGGVMYYVQLDVRNVSRWFQGAIGVSGSDAMDITGYVVYFSDRRTNRNALNQETAEYGFEDFVNRDSQAGTPDGVLEPTGEDVNGDGQLDVYGQNPILPVGAVAPYTNALRPWVIENPAGTPITGQIAQVNRPVFFRRALKVVGGSLGNIVLPGLSVVSENPVYVQGDFNASVAAGFGNPHAATAVMTDAITLLSNAWNDRNSFTSPHGPAGRQATTTWYRFAVIAGKGPSFERPTWQGSFQDLGTDGGAHNFLRYIERWSGATLNYRGAIASFYFNRQAVGIYKCCNNVYSPPTRAFNFDIDFLQPSLLPPRTPMFRDINTTLFTQITAPGQ